ncbi:MAG: hypothetical protein ACI8XI_000689 [Woeseiaceae bacterium]|jgi:hypothetical protein|tara:strand:- start:1484 stop:1600 length:117 start_codon:yes stop_codon:yes gene_type:complete
MHDVEITVGKLNELDDPDCREFSIGEDEAQAYLSIRFF